jgi:hypothetical protein
MPVESVGGAMMPSPLIPLETIGAFALGAVGDALQADTIKEATAASTRVRWRRDMDDSVVG